MRENLAKTLVHLEELAEEAVNAHQRQTIALPECFNFVYNMDSSILKVVAETINGGETCHTLSKLSEKFGIYIVGGSVIERDGVNLYNSSMVWNVNGELIARHRKAS